MDTESKLVLTNVEGNAVAETAPIDIGILHAVASLPDSSGPLELSLLGGDADADGATSVSANDPSDAALFLHTSGTTSRPKGVPLTHLNLAVSVKNVRSVYRLNESDSTVIVLPLFHVRSLVAALLSSLSAGASMALPAVGCFFASTFWADMCTTGATWYTTVPTIHQILLDRHASRPKPLYSKLWFIRSCSVSLVPAILEHLKDAFGTPMLEAYAMTEASFEKRLDQIWLKYRSGTDKKVEQRMSRKSRTASSGGKKKGSVLLLAVPLRELVVAGGVAVEVGFIPYNERINGQIAGIGLAALLLVELGRGKELLISSV